MGLSAEIRKLFDEHGTEDWWRDGVFDEELWASAPRKVLFLLKDPNQYGRGGDEPNGIPQKDFSLVETTQGNAHSIDWDGWVEIARWAYAILKTGPGVVPDIKGCHSSVPVPGVSKPVEEWMICRHQVGVMNLKKDPGGATVVIKDVADWARDHKDFLRTQLQLINPQIVVLCGNRPLKEIAAESFGLSLPESVMQCGDRELKQIAEEVRGLKAPESRMWPYVVANSRLWIGLRHYNRADTDDTFYALVGIMQAALRDPEAAAVLRGTKGD